MDLIIAENYGGPTVIIYHCSWTTVILSGSISSHNSLFGHVARLGKDTAANQALQRKIDLSLGRLPDRTWKRPPGRPRSKWLDQISSDNNLPCTC